MAERDEELEALVDRLNCEFTARGFFGYRNDIARHVQAGLALGASRENEACAVVAEAEAEDMDWPEANVCQAVATSIRARVGGRG